MTNGFFWFCLVLCDWYKWSCNMNEFKSIAKSIKWKRRTNFLLPWTRHGRQIYCPRSLSDWCAWNGGEWDGLGFIGRVGLGCVLRVERKVETVNDYTSLKCLKIVQLVCRFSGVHRWVQGSSERVWGLVRLPVVCALSGLNNENPQRY